MKKIVIAVVVIVALAAGGGWMGYRWWRNTPEYALSQVRRSFEDHDIARFREYVDLDTVLDRGVDSLLSTMPEQEEGWANTLAQGLVKLMKPTLIAEARKGIESWIEKGQIQEPSAEGQDGGAAGQGSKIGQIGELRYKGMGDKRQEGKTTFITLNLHHEKYDHDFGVEIMMRETPEGHLQIAEISNLAEVVQELDAEEAKWKAEQNRPVREKIDAAVQVVKLDKSTRQDRWGIEKKIVFKATVKNTSDQPITRIEGKLTATASTDPPRTKTWPVYYDQPVAAGTEQEMTWEMDANQFIEEEAAIFGAGQDQLDLSLTPELVRFEDGEEAVLLYR